MGFGADVKAMAGMSACFASAGLAEGAAANTIKIAAPNGAGVDFCIDGIAYHKADTDNIAVTAHAQQAVATKCLYLVQIDSNGDVTTKKGTEVLTADLTAGTKVLQWPDVDDDNAAIGGYKVETNASTTFTNGTTDLGAGGITDTYYNFMGSGPLAPLTS